MPQEPAALAAEVRLPRGARGSLSQVAWIGWGAALLAALLGAGWQVATRRGVTTTLGPVEMAWLRYAIPALLLGALLPRVRISIPHALWLTATGGLPFGLLVLSGASWAPAAHIGVFMAGAMPLFTALASWCAWREPLSRTRVAGLVVVLAGVVTLGWNSLGGGLAGSWRGDLLFLLAAATWACYTIGLRTSGLSPWHAAATVNAGSALVLLLALPWIAPQRLFTAPLPDVLLQAVWQGLLAGVLGLVAYSVAVARLGPTRGALSSALVPLLTAFAAAAFLGEALDTRTLVACVLVAAGVALAARTASPRR